MHSHGTILRKVVRHGERRLFAGTFFFRDRPRLELIPRSDLTIAGCDPCLVHITGLHDIVVAIDFLGHLRPGGAAKLARSLGWQRLAELIGETRQRNPSVRQDGPCKWWGLEPLSENMADWKMRYASAFPLGEDG
jgi:hypothetical protein